MPAQILPAASLRSSNCLPAARALLWASNYLMYIPLWSIGWVIFGAGSNFSCSQGGRVTGRRQAGFGRRLPHHLAALIFAG